MGDENVIFIGKKNTKNYVLAVITQLNQGTNKILLKSRGKAISRAVDVAEMIKNRFAKDIKVKDILISTEEVPSEEGKTLRVSAMEIVLERG